MAPVLHLIPVHRSAGAAAVTANEKMESDAFEAAHSRYTAAYAAYIRAAKRVAKLLADGLTPSAEEIRDEAKATEELATARREFLDLLNGAEPPKR